MARRRSSSIPIQISHLEDNSERSVREKIFRRSSSLGITLINDCMPAERRSSLRSFFSKVDDKEDAISTPNFQEERHIELFKSKEFQAHLKEHHITTSAGAQIFFQQFLHDRNSEEITLGLSASDRDEAAVPMHMRKKSGDSLSIASRCAKPTSKRRGTNGSEHSHYFESAENSLDESLWSLDDSRRQSYLSVIRGDTESFFRPPQDVKEIIEHQVNDIREEDSGIRSFIRRSSSAMVASIDTSYRSRRGSLFSSIGSKGNASLAPSFQSSMPNAADVRRSLTEGVRSADDVSVSLEDLVRDLDDDDARVEDDRSNNGKVEVFFPSRRSSCSSYDAPPRRSSLISHTSETSSHLQKCLNEINTDNILSAHLHTLLGGDDDTVESGDGDSVGTITSFATDQALLCKRVNIECTQDAEADMPRRPKFVELDFDPRKLSYLPRSNTMYKNNSCSNLASDSGQLQKDFIASRGSLLVEWDEAYDSEDDSV